MKAWRNLYGQVVEIDVDVDPQGNPLLPPDTTTDPKPEPLEGHYVTVVGREWVQIPIPVVTYDFSYLQQQALDRLNRYKAWYLNQPVEVNGRPFDNDETARARVSQAILAHQLTGFLPEFWVDANNQRYPINSVDDLKTIAVALQDSFNTRFVETNTIRQQILAATTEDQLNAVEIPTIPMF
jgi:hypothetical protein